MTLSCAIGMKPKPTEIFMREKNPVEVHCLSLILMNVSTANYVALSRYFARHIKRHEVANRACTPHFSFDCMPTPLPVPCAHDEQPNWANFQLTTLVECGFGAPLFASKTLSLPMLIPPLVPPRVHFPDPSYTSKLLLLIII